MSLRKHRKAGVFHKRAPLSGDAKRAMLRAVRETAIAEFTKILNTGFVKRLVNEVVTGRRRKRRATKITKSKKGSRS